MSSPPRAPHVRGDDALLENDVPMATSHNPPSPPFRRTFTPSSQGEWDKPGTSQEDYADDWGKSRER
jgi:hypothetical protein